MTFSTLLETLGFHDSTVDRATYSAEDRTLIVDVELCGSCQPIEDPEDIIAGQLFISGVKEIEVVFLPDPRIEREVLPVPSTNLCEDLGIDDTDAEVLGTPRIDAIDDVTEKVSFLLVVYRYGDRYRKQDYFDVSIIAHHAEWKRLSDV
jgi:hypothetical protein